MSTLDSLIRLHRWQVDERRRHVAALEGLAEKLRLEMARLAAERAADETAAGASFLARHVYPGYIRRALERQKTLERSLAEVETQTVQARDALAEAFQELKRYEITQAERRKREQIEADRRTQAQLDEISLQQHQRRIDR